MDSLSLSHASFTTVKCCRGDPLSCHFVMLMLPVTCRLSSVTIARLCAATGVGVTDSALFTTQAASELPQVSCEGDIVQHQPAETLEASGVEIQDAGPQGLGITDPPLFQLVSEESEI